MTEPRPAPIRHPLGDLALSLPNGVRQAANTL
jgi:hypothetical protein